MAKLTLQEQLLKSGLVGIGQVRSAKAEKHKQAKQPNKGDAIKAEAKKARLEQAERDRELNQLRKEQEERNQIAAQIKQIIEQNRLPLCDSRVNSSDDYAYHFTDSNKVKTLYVTNTMRDQLVRGEVAIVKLGKRYDVVTAEIANKIKCRDGNAIIVFNNGMGDEKTQDDPYAAYQVPDDLMW